MEATRISGLLLMLISALVFGGINYESLHPDFFLLGMLMFPVGFFVFMKANRVALSAAEERAAEAIRPTIRNATADAHVDKQR